MLDGQTEFGDMRHSEYGAQGFSTFGTNVFTKI